MTPTFRPFRLFARPTARPFRRRLRGWRLSIEPLEERLAPDATLPSDLVVGRTQSAYSTVDVRSNTVSVTYTVYNQRADDLTGVLLTDTLQPGVAYSTATQLPDRNGQELAWSLGTIPGYGRASVTLTLTLPTPLPLQIDAGARAFATVNAGAVSADTPAATLTTRPLPAAQLASTPDANTTDPFVQEQAARLRYDPAAIFDYLNTQVGYESYVGSLRGARGTLWSAAGNSLDEASLGVALFRASGLPARYAHGTLSDALSKQLILSMFPATYQTVGYIPAGTATADPANDPTLLTETRDHYWLQVDTGAGFVDADTSGLGGAAIGAAYTTATDTFTEVADGLRHKVQVKLDAEIYSQAAAAFGLGDGRNTTTVLDRTFNSVELVGRPLTVGFFVNESAIGAIVFSSRSMTYTPYFALGDLADPDLGHDETLTGTAFQEVMTNFPLGSQLLTGLFLRSVVTGPDGPGESYDRTLVDRVGYAGRQGLAGGAVSVDPNGPPAVSPTDSVTLFASPSALSRNPGSLLAAEIQKLRERAAAQSNDADQWTTSPAAATARASVFALARLAGLEFLVRSGDYVRAAQAVANVRGYADRPRLTLVQTTTKLTVADPTRATLQFAIDLSRNDIRAVPAPGVSSRAAAAFSIARGMIDTLLEARALSNLTGANVETAGTAAAVFAAAAAQHIGTVVIGSDNLSALDTLAVSEEAKARIAAAVHRGQLVIVPAGPVPVAGGSTTAWFEANPVSGQTIGVTENGGHQAIAEYTALLLVKGGIYTGILLAVFARFDGDNGQDIKNFVNNQYTGPLSVAAAGASQYLTFLPPGFGLGYFLFTGAFFAAFNLFGLLIGLDPDASAGLFSVGTGVYPAGRQGAAATTVAATRAAGPVAAGNRSASAFVAGSIRADWSSASVTTFDPATLSAAGAVVTDAAGNPIGSGSVALSTAAPVTVSGQASFTVAGTGSLAFYGPAEPALGVAGEWDSYTATVTGSPVLTLTVPAGAVTLNGAPLPAGTYTVRTTSATLTGRGHTSSQTFAGSASVSVTTGTVALGPGSGTATVGDSPLDLASGATLVGYTGTVSVASDGSPTDRVTLSGTAANVLSVSATPAAVTADQNTPATFLTAVSTSLTDTYTVSAEAPDGWTVAVDAAGRVTVTPAAGLQGGTFPVRVVVTSAANGKLVAQTTVPVTLLATQPGLAFAVQPDPLLTVPFQGAQLPSAFRAGVRNLGPAADTYTVAASNLPTGFQLLSSGDRVTVPAGQTGILGLYLQPIAGTTLPAPGTVLTFAVTATSTTDPTITKTQTVTFTMPEVHGVTLTANPVSLSTTPGDETPVGITIKAVGNVPETVALSTSAVAGLTAAGFPASVTLAVGQTVTVNGTLTPATDTPLNSTLAATLTATFGGSSQTLQLPVRVAIPGADAIAAASVTAGQLGRTDLANRLTDLATALTTLFQHPTDPVPQGQAVAALDALAPLVTADPDLGRYATGLTTGRDRIADATSAADVGTATIALGAVLDQLNATLQAVAAHGGGVFLDKNLATLLPGVPSTFQVGLRNDGSLSTTFDLSVTGLPAGITVAFDKPSVTLQPGETLFGGANGVTLSFTPTGETLVPVGFTVIATPRDAAGISRSVTGSLTVRPAFVQVAAVTVAPAFGDPGTQFAVGARVLNAVNRPQTVTATFAVKDASGTTVYTSPPTTAALTLDASLLNLSLGTVDTAGFPRGSYTVVVTLTDAGGNPIPGGTGQASLLVGTPVVGTLTSAPLTLPQGTGAVTNTLVLQAQTAFAPPFTLAGQVATTAVSSTLVIRGTLAYVAGSNGVDIIDASDPTAPAKLGTFAQSLIVQGGYTVVRELPGDRIAVASTTTFNANGTRVLVYSLADPLNPALVSNTVIPQAFMTDFLVSGSRGLLTTNGVFLFGNNDAGDPFDQFGDVTAIDFDAVGGPAVTDRLFGTRNPPFTGNNGEFGGEFVTPTVAYVTGTTLAGGDFLTGAGRLLVVDATDPADLTLANTVLIPGTVTLSEVAVAGNLALVVGSTKGGQDPYNNLDADPSNDSGSLGNLTLTTLDISDPLNPVVLSTVVTAAVFPRGNQPSSKLAVVPVGGGKFAVSLGIVGGQPVIFLVDASNPTAIATAAFRVNAVVSEMTVRNDQLYTTSADGLLVYDVGQVVTVPVTASVTVPTGTGVTVVLNSFNIPPTRIEPGAGFDTLVFERQLASGLAAETITWQESVANLTAGESRDVTLGGTVAFTAGGTPGALALAGTTVTAAPIIGLSPPTRTTRPGAPTDFTVTLVNPTGAAVTYTLGAVGVPAGWASLPAVVSVPANGTATRTVTLTPDAFTALADYGFAVTVTGSNGARGSVQGTLTVAGAPVLPDPEAHGVVVGLTPGTATAGQGTTTKVVVRVTNTGSTTETFTLSAANLPGTVAAVFGQPSVTVPPGASNFREVVLALTSTVGTDPGSFPFTVTASAGATTATAAGALAVVSNGVTVRLNRNTAAPGDTLLATVTNTGTVADTFDLTTAGVAGLVAALGRTTLSLAPGESADVPVTAGAMPFAVQGSAPLTVAARSQGNPTAQGADTAGVQVGPTVGLTTGFDPASRTLPAPGGADFVLTVRNTGNTEDAYTATITDLTGGVTAYLVGLDGRPTQTIPTFRLPGLATGAIVVHTNLPAAGLGTVTVTVRSLTDPTRTAVSTAALQTASVAPPPPPARVPQPALAGGPADGSAVVLTPTAGGYAVGQRVDFFPGFAGAARVATGDLTGDGVADYVGGAGPGGGPRVAVIDGATGRRLADFFAFEDTFRGGVYVTLGDLDGDGVADLVVTPDLGGGPVVVVYSGAALAAGADPAAAQRNRFFGIEDTAFRGGARAAAGDVNGDGRADLVVSAGFPGGPRVALYSGAGLATAGAAPIKLMSDFFAFEDTFRNGSYVAVGDVDGDGRADLVFGAGPGGGPRVRAVSGPVLLARGGGSLDGEPNLTPEQFTQQMRLGDPFVLPVPELADFFASDLSLRGGVRVAARDADGDGTADLVVGSGEGEPGRVRLYRAADLLAGATASQELDPFDGAVLPNGVFVG